jgi:hypothetical protein
MRRDVSLTVYLFVMILVAAPMATADVPHQMNYQGQLTDELGAPLDTVVSMTFTIYNDSSGGTVLWTETQAGVEVSGGLFDVLLGSAPPIPDTVFADDWTWLGIQIGADPEIAPLTKLVTVPYAFRVATVDGAAGGNVYGNLLLHSSLYVGDYDGESGQLRITDGADNTIIGYGSSGNLNIGGNLDVSGKATIGFGNINTGSDAFVAGRVNEVSDDYATVGGGFGNTASGLRSTVGGGMWNLAGAVHATVAGGHSDTVDAPGGTIGGGTENRAAGDYATISGGTNNTVSSSYGTVSGGRNNTAGNLFGTIAGGQYNTAGGGFSTISGGMQNDANGSGSTIGGGSSDTANGSLSTISGGHQNAASGDSATISGGSGNSATGNNSAIGGGTGNEASFISLGPPMDPLGGWSTVGGGRDNRALGDYSTIGGGRDNTAAAGWTPTYGGYSTVAGGQDNHAFAMYSTVSGGRLDSARTQYATVGGGYMNVAGAGLLANPDSGEAATVAGGYSNRAAGYFSAIGGGESNTASGWYSTVSGGISNDNAGSYSTIPGGYNGTLTSNANYSMAFGRDVYVNTAYRVAFFDSAYSGRLGLNRDDHSAGISHPIHVGTDPTNGNGAYLSAGGSWQNGSSRSFKENFQSLDSKELLAKISELPVEAWQYKNSDERHIGPVSEDFAQAFDVGAVVNGRRDNKYLSPGDVAGVALAGVKELIQENQELKQIIHDLRKRIEDLEETEAPR